MSSFVVFLAIMLTISDIGTALRCNQCYYQSNQPKDQQTCSDVTVDCRTGYCYSAAYTRSDGVSVVRRGCDNNPKDRLCPNNNGATCRRKTLENNLKSCVGTCCTTDNCNNLHNHSSVLKCNECHYQSNQPNDQQKCDNAMVDCPIGYCYSVAYTRSDGVSVVERGCDKPNDKFCPSSANTCKRRTLENNLKSCVGICCTTDNCNNYNPSSVLKCNQCHYQSNYPKDQQKCGNIMVDCPTGYCYSATYTTSDNITVVVRSCDHYPNDRLCPDDDGETCKNKTQEHNWKSCVGICCTTDNCNNFTPSSATGVMAEKFTLCVMIVVGFIFV